MQVGPKMKYREKDSDAQSSTRNRVLVDASPKDQLRSQLLRFGFKLHHVNAAIVERAELSQALDWLVLKVPEQELPAKFAAESSKASVQVLVRGKQATSKAYEHIGLSSNVHTWRSALYVITLFVFFSTSLLQFYIKLALINSLQPLHRTCLTFIVRVRFCLHKWLHTKNVVYGYTLL